MDDRTRGRLLRAGRLVFAAVIAVLLVRAAVDHWSDLREVELRFDWWWLLAAAPFPLVAGVVLPLAWRSIVAAHDTPLPPRTAVRVWWLSQTGRFVPGYVTWVASRVVMAGKEGVGRRLAAASLLLEAGLIALWGAVLASWVPSSSIAGPLRLLLGAGGVAGLVALPWVLPLARRLLPVTDYRPSGIYGSVALFGLNALLRGGGLVLVTAAVHPIEAGDAWLIIGAANAGMVVGMVGITPAGLGVREGAIAALLGARFGVGDAAALAVLYRAWDFAFELVWLAIALRLRGRAVPAAAEDRR